MTKYSITRLLVKKRALENQLESGISIVPLLYKATAANYKAEQADNAIKAQQASVDRYKSLLEKRAKIAGAIALSNATNIVTINNVSMTVAEAIDRKNNIDQEKSLYVALANAVSRLATQEANNDAEVSKQITQRITAVSGREADLTPAVIETIEASVRAQFKEKVAAMPHLDAKATALKESIDKFMEEVDVCLNESNATTMVELEL